MKRKIDTIKGKRLVMGGGTNILTKNEILVTETSNGIELKERSSDGSIKELAGGGNNTDQINVFDLVKNPRFVCITNDTSHSATGPADFIIGEASIMTPCAVYNKKKAMGVYIAFDIINNGFKGFPLYIMFDYDYPNLIGGGVTLGTSMDKAIQDYPEDGYYITKDEFLKVWNEATLL